MAAQKKRKGAWTWEEEEKRGRSELGLIFLCSWLMASSDVFEATAKSTLLIFPRCS
jgi:hypothetical protein